MMDMAVFIRESNRIEDTARCAVKQGRRLAKADPSPIRARRLDEREYERRLRRSILDPLFTQWRSGLATAGSAVNAVALLDGLPLRDLGLIPEKEAARAMKRIEGYHKTKLVSTFRSALAVDIRPLLSDAPIHAAMDARIADNVRLIRTIPRRAHEGLTHQLRRELVDAPFDEARLSTLLRREYGSSSFNVRRLARDQTNKTIGQLTELRHRQMGIDEYIWQTVQDERVRSTHAELNGTRQHYNRPPSVGHPGSEVLCRCAAQAVIPGAGIG